MRSKSIQLICLLLAGVSLLAVQARATMDVTAEEAEAIAEEAYIYAYPMLENYRRMYVQAVDPGSGAFRGPFNHLSTLSRLLDSEFNALDSPPNIELHYDFAWLNLEAEPLVLSVPTTAEDRYYALQFIDMYTHNFAYVGSRETGFGDGHYLIAGPYWSGKVPHGIARVLRADGNFVLVLGRTQVENSRELKNGDADPVQYNLKPLSVFLRRTPEQGPESDFPPYDREKIASAAFIGYLNFLMGQMRQRVGEADLLESFAKIGIGPNRLFDPSELAPDVRLSIENGVKSAIDRIAAESHKLGEIKNAWQLPYGVFGSYDEMQGRYLVRAAAAMVGLYGQTADEAFYPLSTADGDGRSYDGSKHNYTIRFEKDAFPPVRGFWSLSSYQLPERRLVNNGINRYVIGDRTDGLKMNPDGSLTIRIQHHSPGPDLASNWLPAPDGPFYLVMRLYWPSDVVAAGDWVPPPVNRLK